MSIRRWQFTLAVAVTASVAGNVRFAWLTGSIEYAIEAGAVAAVAPAFLFLVTHNLAAEPAGITRGWRQKAALTGTWAITMAAFAASYQELHAYVQFLGLPATSSWLTPAIVDATIAVASVKVLAPAVASATSDHAVAVPPAAPVANAVAAAHAGTGLHLVAGIPERFMAGTGHVAAEVAGDAPTGVDAHRDRAQALVAAGVVRADPAAVAAALASLAGGGSHRAIAAATGLHRTSVARLATAAEEATAVV